MTATDAAILAAKLASENDEDPLLQRLGQEAGLDVGLANVRGEKKCWFVVGQTINARSLCALCGGSF